MLELLSNRVMVFGTFDVFHPGHEFFLNAAKERGEELIVVIARDKTVKRIKPQLRNAERIRQQVLQEAFPDVQVILGDEEDPMKVVREYRPGLICLGYDQVGFSEELQKEYPEIPVERIEAFHPDKYKSSKM